MSPDLVNYIRSRDYELQPEPQPDAEAVQLVDRYYSLRGQYLYIRTARERYDPQAGRAGWIEKEEEGGGRRVMAGAICLGVIQGGYFTLADGERLRLVEIDPRHA